jgi:peptidoglycan/LPS O-acetylase OafA/YrhL
MSGLKWLMVLPATVVAYFVCTALLALIGGWFYTGGLLALAVSIFTGTIPYWIVLHVFDPSAVIYLAQAMLAPAFAIQLGVRVAPAHRFGVAVALFGLFLVIVGATLFAELYLNASRDPGAHPFGLVVAGVVLGLIAAGVSVASLRAAPQSTSSQPALA